MEKTEVIVVIKNGCAYYYANTPNISVRLLNYDDLEVCPPPMVDVYDAEIEEAERTMCYKSTID